MMKRITLAFLLGMAGVHPLYAGGGLGPVFKSGFEFDESCIDFDGVGDSVIIPVITISGDFILNGGSFPASEFDDAMISFRNRLTGGTFEIGNTHDLNYSVNIIPGRYDVLYSSETAGDETPHNTGAVLMSDVDLQASRTLDIEVTSYMLGGNFLLNGVPFPGVEYDDAVIFLESELAGTLELGETKFQAFADVPALPGDYDIRYQLETPGDLVPRNQWGLVGQTSVTGNNPSIEIDVPSVAISGTFKHNGVTMPADDGDDGRFYLETVSGDRALLGNSHEQTFEKNIMPGTYDLYWEKESPGATVPFNPRARVATGLVTAGGDVPVDMSSHIMAGDFALNGLAFPASDKNTARIVARDAATGDSTVLRQTHFGSYNRRMVDATYDLFYQHEAGPLVPQNLLTSLGSVSVQSDVTFDIGIQAGTFAALANLDGAPFPANMSQSGNILLRDRTSPDWANAGTTDFLPIQALLVAGSYDVYYSHAQGDQVPRNKLALILENVVIEGPPPVTPHGGGLQLEVNSLVINGQMFRNDVVTPPSEFDDGILTLIRGVDSIEIGNTNDQTYQVRLIDHPEPPLYLVRYSAESRGETMPLNENAYVMCLVLDPVPL